MDRPTIGRDVWYRSATGFLAPAKVVTTIDTIAPHGAAEWERTGGLQGMPPLDDERHVHLVVFTAGVTYTPPTPGPGVDVPEGGTFREWNVPGVDIDGRLIEPGHLGDLVDEMPPRSWCWPARFTPSQLAGGGA